MEEHNQLNKVAKSEEITLKELILKVKEFFFEIKAQWKIVFLITLPFVLFFFIKAYLTPPNYMAELTFMVNEDEGGGGGAMGILSQFGISAGGGRPSNIEKILELSKSRKIVQKALFQPTIINQKEDFFANHLISTYDFHDKWKDNKMGLKAFEFETDNFESFTLKENLAVKNIYNRILGRGNYSPLFFTSYNEDTGIMTFRTISRSTQLSIDWLNHTFKTLSKFYTEKAVEKQKVTYDLVQAKVDSVQKALNTNEVKLAKLKDSSRGIYTNTAYITEGRLTREVQVLNIMFGESVRNLEIADFALKNKTPFIQIIDAPIAPVTPVIESKIKAIATGGLMGLFIALAFVIGRKVIRDSLTN